MDDFFAHYYRTNPVSATFTGMHDFDDRLPDWSCAAREADVLTMRALHDALERSHPRGPRPMEMMRDDPVALDAELARANLETRIAEHDSGFFIDRNPALWTGEAIFGPVSLMLREFAPVHERLPSLGSRLAAIPGFLGTMRATIAGPIPARWRARAVRECTAAMALFSDGLEGWLSVHGGSPSLVRAAARDAVAAFETTRAWLEGRDTAADEAYSAGESLFSTMLERGHFCATPPRELLARAEGAMVREQHALHQALAERGTDWTGAQAAMAADHPGATEYYGAFARRWVEIRSGVLAQDGVTWPDWPIRYVPIPGWARATAPGLYWLFYRSPSPFDPYDVHDYAVAPVDDTMSDDEQRDRLAAWNHSTITLNHVVHHGGVGHHVQNWHAVHRSSLRVGRVAAVDCASRIGMFQGGSMAEGWACYATGLTEELGLLSPLEQLSEQHTRVRLLARAIVDQRLHLGDWTFTECVRYYEAQTGMSPEVAAAETTKNSMFPATALMYWLGTQGILDLRASVRETAGASFSLRAFHDELLGRGSIPVLLAARLMRPDMEHA